MRVDGLVDALVAERGDQAVGSAGQLDRDRHRAVFRLEAFGHMRGEYRISVEPGGLRAGPRRVGSGLRGGCGVAGSAAVAVDLGVDRGAVPAETAGDHRVGLTAFDPCADLFAFRRGQGVGLACWASPPVGVVCEQRAVSPASRSDRWRLNPYLTV